MKILLTGVTNWQMNRFAKQRIHLVDTYPQCIDRALRLAGHDVDYREAAPGEDLDPYDAVVLGLTAFQSVSARNAAAPVDLMSRARHEGKGLVLYFDDWQLNSARSDIKQLGQHPERLLKDMFHARLYNEWLEGKEDQIVWLFTALDKEQWPLTIIPTFPWGDRGLIYKVMRGNLTEANTAWLDLTSVYAYPQDLPPVRAPEDRERTWISAALTAQPAHWVAKQEFSWPVEHVGKTDPELRGRFLHPVPERDLIVRYGEAWGLIGGRYHHSGAGWMRARILHAAAQGCLFYGPANEVPLDGYFHPLSVLEGMSTELLTEQAQLQRDLVFGNVMPKDELLTGLDETLRRAMP